MLINGKELNITSHAYLHEADLRGAELREVNLRWADLDGAELHGADLRGADLRGADLRWAELRWADLRGADLRGAKLHGADLRWAELDGADLRGADLRGAKNVPALVAAVTSILPEGDLIGWKRCLDNVIVKLRIPADAERSNGTGRKCRASAAVVLEVFGATYGVSIYDPHFTYHVGAEIAPISDFDSDRWNECGSGIHFFITREEAEGNLV